MTPQHASAPERKARSSERRAKQTARETFEQIRDQHPHLRRVLPKHVGLILCAMWERMTRSPDRVCYESADSLAHTLDVSERWVRKAQKRLYEDSFLFTKLMAPGFPTPRGPTRKPLRVYRLTLFNEAEQLEPLYAWENDKTCAQIGYGGRRARDVRDSGNSIRNAFSELPDGRSGNSIRIEYPQNRSSLEGAVNPKATTTTHRPGGDRPAAAPGQRQGLAPGRRETTGAIAADHPNDARSSGRAPNGATPSRSSTSSSPRGGAPDTRPGSTTSRVSEAEANERGGRRGQTRNLDGDALTVMRYRRDVLRKLGLLAEDDPPHYQLEIVKHARLTWSVEELCRVVDLVAKSGEHAHIRNRFTVRYLFDDPGPGVILDRPPPRAPRQPAQDGLLGRGPTPGTSGRRSPSQNGTPGHADFVNHSTHVAHEQVSEGSPRARTADELRAELDAALNEGLKDTPPKRKR